MPGNAINNNEKLFPVFARRLSTSTHPVSYIGAADRLSVWLNSSKAYYPVARPKIVELLEIARTTVEREIPDTPLTDLVRDSSLCPPTKAPSLNAYTKLVRTVMPFYHLFPELDLQQRLRVLLSAIGIDVDSIPRPIVKKARQAPSTSFSPSTPSVPSMSSAPSATSAPATSSAPSTSPVPPTSPAPSRSSESRVPVRTSARMITPGLPKVKVSTASPASSINRPTRSPSMHISAELIAQQSPQPTASPAPVPKSDHPPSAEASKKGPGKAAAVPELPGPLTTDILGLIHMIHARRPQNTDALMTPAKQPPTPVAVSEGKHSHSSPIMPSSSGSAQPQAVGSSIGVLVGLPRRNQTQEPASTPTGLSIPSSIFTTQPSSTTSHPAQSPQLVSKPKPRKKPTISGNQPDFMMLDLEWFKQEQQKQASASTTGSEVASPVLNVAASKTSPSLPLAPAAVDAEPAASQATTTADISHTPSVVSSADASTPAMVLSDSTMIPQPSTHDAIPPAPKSTAPDLETPIPPSETLHPATFIALSRAATQSYYNPLSHSGQHIHNPQARKKLHIFNRQRMDDGVLPAPAPVIANESNVDNAALSSSASRKVSEDASGSKSVKGGAGPIDRGIDGLREGAIPSDGADSGNADVLGEPPSSTEQLSSLVEGITSMDADMGTAPMSKTVSAGDVHMVVDQPSVQLPPDASVQPAASAKSEPLAARDRMDSGEATESAVQGPEVAKNDLVSAAAPVSAPGLPVGHVTSISSAVDVNRMSAEHINPYMAADASDDMDVDLDEWIIIPPSSSTPPQPPSIAQEVAAESGEQTAAAVDAPMAVHASEGVISQVQQAITTPEEGTSPVVEVPSSLQMEDGDLSSSASHFQAEHAKDLSMVGEAKNDQAEMDQLHPSTEFDIVRESDVTIGTQVNEDSIGSDMGIEQGVEKPSNVEMEAAVPSEDEGPMPQPELRQSPVCLTPSNEGSMDMDLGSSSVVPSEHHDDFADDVLFRKRSRSSSVPHSSILRPAKRRSLAPDTLMQETGDGEAAQELEENDPAAPVAAEREVAVPDTDVPMPDVAVPQQEIQVASPMDQPEGEHAGEGERVEASSVFPAVADTVEPAGISPAIHEMSLSRASENPSGSTSGIVEQRAATAEIATPQAIPQKAIDIASTSPAPQLSPSSSQVVNGIDHSLAADVRVVKTEDEDELVDELGSIFGRDARFVVAERGSSTIDTPISMRFEISPHYMNKLRRWNNRFKSTERRSSKMHMCLSLACYSFEDVLEAMSGNRAKFQQALDNICPGPWPRTEALHAVANTTDVIPLAPPLIMMDNVVDLSPYAQLGENHIELIQTADMSDYMFVIHAHYPTQNQMQELRKKRQADQEFENFFVEELGRPFVHSNHPWEISVAISR
ncbi:hypothetical protein EW146_g4924 [Bondarzewia mesenterica]|uniref:Uncharacterized protein n=1 Tax=Bondarzewia mesenterica TaxID=1095465 RepID=A0A4S4LUW6_9AGAM|nr:hypothetical protein EW146_g4924 [Bondarzewia mesenterica]